MLFGFLETQVQAAVEQLEEILQSYPPFAPKQFIHEL